MSAMIAVGAGECGVRAAVCLREAGWSGAIELLGLELWEPYERPRVSKQALAEESEKSSPTTIFDESYLEERQIFHRAGVRVLRIDRDKREVVLVSGERLPYNRVLLATGAIPRLLDLAAGSRRTHVLRTHDDAVRLRSTLAEGSRVVVIGGGFIGLELAAAAATRGCSVTILETADRILNRGVPPTLAAFIERRHIAAGVTFHYEVKLSSVHDSTDETIVELADGREIACDVLVVGIGAVPDTDVADKSGLDIENGVRVNEYLATSDPEIFAAGDCASFPHQLYDGRRLRLEAWRNARDQAAVVAANMCGDKQPFTAVPWFWSDQYDLGLQVAGLPNEAAQQVSRPTPSGSDILFGLSPDGRILSAAAVGPGNSVAKDIKLAEMMIARRLHPSPEALADPAVNLKQLLRE